MADERYQKFLGIEPADDNPTYYELLALDPADLDAESLEKAYKTQIRKLQSIRTSKDAGFIEYLKETLRSARRILKDPQRRKEYDASLAANAEKDFREFVGPLLAMLSQAMIDTVLVPKAIGDGLSEERAREIIAELASEAGVTIAAEAEAEPEPEPEEESYDEEDDYEGGYEPRPAAPRPDPMRSADGASASDLREAAPVGTAEAPRRVVMPPWVMPESETDSLPWGRGGSRSWGQARKRMARKRSADLIDESWLDDESRAALGEAIRSYNHGARLAKVGSDVHRNLRAYFPPHNGKQQITPRINGVSYEKLFETERKTYQDALKAFREAVAKVANVQSSRAEEIRERGTMNLALVKGILDEMTRHKMALMGGLSQSEELRAWQAFVGSRRSPRLHKTVAELSS